MKHPSSQIDVGLVAVMNKGNIKLIVPFITVGLARGSIGKARWWGWGQNDTAANQ